MPSRPSLRRVSSCCGCTSLHSERDHSYVTLFGVRSRYSHLKVGQSFSRALRVPSAIANGFVARCAPKVRLVVTISVQSLSVWPGGRKVSVAVTLSRAREADIHVRPSKSNFQASAGATYGGVLGACGVPAQ